MNTIQAPLANGGRVLPEITFWISGSAFGTTTFEDVKQQIKKIREAYDDGTCKLRILIKETPLV